MHKLENLAINQHENCISYCALRSFFVKIPPDMTLLLLSHQNAGPVPHFDTLSAGADLKEGSHRMFHHYKKELMWGREGK